MELKYTPLYEDKDKRTCFSFELNQELVLTWDDIKLFIKLLSQQIKEKPDVIVAIGLGGNIPGTLLAKELEVPMLSIQMSSYDDDNKRGKIKVHNTIDHDFIKDKSLLIVDDIIDSGKTMNEALWIFRDKSSTRTCALLTKKDEILSPDYYITRINKDIWVKFPWED